MHTSYIKSGIGALCLSFLGSVGSVAGEANGKKQITPPNPILKSTKIRTTPRPDWNSLAPYFTSAFQEKNKKTLDIYASLDRFKKLSDRFDKIEKKYNIDASKMCIPAGEAWDLTVFPKAMKSVNLSQEQEIVTRAISYIITTALGVNILGTSAYSQDTIICAINGDENTISRGFYDGELKVASFNLHIPEYDADKVVIRDITKTALKNTEDFYDLLRTLSEELVHSAQHYDGVFLAPIASKNNLYYSRTDEKLWDLMLEAHAKVIAANILVHAAMGKKQKDGTYAKGYPFILNHFLQSYPAMDDDSIIQQVLQTQLRHGYDKIKNNPSLLWPAYKAFFDGGSANLYYKQGCSYINKIDPKNRDRIDMKTLIKAFGNIPTMKGNALEKALSGKKPEDIVALLSDGEMKQWLKDGYEAIKSGKNIRDLATGEGQDCFQPVSSGTASLSSSQPQ